MEPSTEETAQNILDTANAQSTQIDMLATVNQLLQQTQMVCNTLSSCVLHINDLDIDYTYILLSSKIFGYLCISKLCQKHFYINFILCSLPWFSF